MYKYKRGSWIVLKNNKNKFCIAKKANKPIETWNFFGGNINNNELPIDCALREFHEEAGVFLNKNKIKLLKKIYYTEEEPTRIIFAYLCNITDNINIKLNKEENSHYKWETLQNLLNYNFNTPSKIILKELLNKYNNLASIDIGDNTNYFKLFNTKEKLKDKPLNEYFAYKKGIEYDKNDFGKRDINKLRKNILYTKHEGNSINTYYMFINGLIVGSVSFDKKTNSLCNLEIKSRYRGNNYSHYLINHILDNEDIHELKIKPEINSPVKEDKLFKLYSSHGFKFNYIDHNKNIVMKYEDRNE